MKNMGYYIWYQRSLSIGPESSGFIVFLLHVIFFLNLVLRNRKNIFSWMFEHDL